MQNNIKDKTDWGLVMNRDPQLVDRYQPVSQSKCGFGDRESSVSSGELHNVFQVTSEQLATTGNAPINEWVTTSTTRKRPLKSLADFAKRGRYTRSVCQWRLLGASYTPVLNGSHGEVTEGDDMSSSTGAAGNYARSRLHREARTFRYSAGGSSRKGMGKGPVSNAVASVNSEIFDSDVSSVVSLNIDFTKHVVEVKRWGVYSGCDSFLKRLQTAIVMYTRSAIENVTSVPLNEAAPVCLGAVLVGGISVPAIADATQPYLGKWGSRALGVGLASAFVAYNWFVDRDTAPFLEGAGAQTNMVAANPTRVNHLDLMSYTSWQEGEVYNHISSKLISEFTGCRVDEHLARRALKRANELCIEISLVSDRGILANTVSYALCVLNVEMARVGVSLRSYSGVPSSSGWT